MLAWPDVLAQPIASGGANTTSQATSLGSATTAGNTLVILAATYGATGITTPTGYTRDSGTPIVTQKVYVFRKTTPTAGSDTLPTLTTGAATQKTIWFALELAGLDTSGPLDVVSALATATAQSISTAAAAGTGYDTLGLVLFAGQDATGTTPPTWTTTTTAWVDVGQQGAADAITSYGAMLAALPIPANGLPNASGTSSLGSNGPLAAVAVKYLAGGSRQAADIRTILGFEWGTSAGLTTGVSATTNALLGNRLLDATTGTVAVTASTPRTGGYCLEIGSGASAIHNAEQVFTGSARVSVWYPFRFATLPATDTEVCTLITATGTNCVVRYLAATQTIGVKIGGGTEAQSAEQVTAGSYHTIDLDLDVSTLAYAASWQLNGIDQPQATLAAGVVTTCSRLRLGWGVASAAVMRVDDVIVAGRKGNWPLGGHRVILLKPDPAETPAVNGTVGNFALVTNNATGAALTSGTLTSARDAIDELPPTIGATADGVCQTTVGTADFLKFPMETYTLAANQVARAVRMLACGWAASTAAKTLAFRGYHGADTPGGAGGDVVTSLGDPTFDNSTTSPAWAAKMYQTTAVGGWTQARLDALEFWMGYSDDATPDVGVHALYAELALQDAHTELVFGEAAADLRVEALVDPFSEGIIALWVYTPAAYSAELVYEIDGVEQTPVSVPASSDPLEIVLRAADMQTISRITLTPVPA